MDEGTIPMSNMAGGPRTHIHLSEEMLPAIKGWKVGEKYTIEIEVEEREIHIETPDKKVGAEFTVLSAKQIKRRKKYDQIISTD